MTDKPVKVYNFQVEDFHTYHVGDCAVWVHNANYLTDKTPKDISEMTRKQLKENTPEDWDFQEHNGRIHIKDDNGNYRVRVDVPDKHTPYNHDKNDIFQHVSSSFSIRISTSSPK